MINLLSITSDIGKYLNQGDGNPWENIQDLSIVISSIIQLILIVAAVLFFVLIVTAGISWMTAGGDKEKLAVSQKKLTSAIIGMFIVLSVWAIIKFVETFFGVTLFPA